MITISVRAEVRYWAISSTCSTFLLFVKIFTPSISVCCSKGFNHLLGYLLLFLHLFRGTWTGAFLAIACFAFYIYRKMSLQKIKSGLMRHLLRKMTKGFCLGHNAVMSWGTLCLSSEMLHASDYITQSSDHGLLLYATCTLLRCMPSLLWFTTGPATFSC